MERDALLARRAAIKAANAGRPRCPATGCTSFGLEPSGWCGDHLAGLRPLALGLFELPRRPSDVVARLTRDQAARARQAVAANATATQALDNTVDGACHALAIARVRLVAGPRGGCYLRGC